MVLAFAFCVASALELKPFNPTRTPNFLVGHDDVPFIVSDGSALPQPTGKTWFVDRKAEGANMGINWADAFTNTNAMPGVVAGDMVFVRKYPSDQ